MQSCKRCGECGETKPLTEFNRSSKGKDGYQWKCRACYKSYNKSRYTYDNALGLLHDDVERIGMLLSTRNSIN